MILKSKVAYQVCVVRDGRRTMTDCMTKEEMRDVVLAARKRGAERVVCFYFGVQFTPCL